VSRPRFWTYLLGPFAVGAVAGAASFDALRSPWLLLAALFFTLPANLIVYGINDIFDYETDVLNARKAGYEAVVPPDRRRMLWTAILATSVPFIAIVPHLVAPARWALLAFLVLAVQYSAPPLRAKARPFMDSLVNVLYVCPGLVGYFVAGGLGFPWVAFMAGWAWCAAMHAFSAVPDIAADARAGIATIATALGAQKTLFLCIALWTVAAALAAKLIGAPLAIVLAVPYMDAGIRALRSKGDSVALQRIYAGFPLTNAAVGMALFFVAASQVG